MCWVELVLLVYSVSMGLLVLVLNYGIFVVFKMFVGWGVILIFIIVNVMV